METNRQGQAVQRSTFGSILGAFGRIFPLGTGFLNVFRRRTTPTLTTDVAVGGEINIDEVEKEALLSDEEAKHFSPVQLELISTLMREKMATLREAYERKMQEERQRAEEATKALLLEKEAAYGLLKEKNDDLEKMLLRQKQDHKAALTSQADEHEQSMDELKEVHSKALDDQKSSYEWRIAHLEEGAKKQEKTLTEKLELKISKLKSEHNEKEAALKEQAQRDLVEERTRSEKALESLKARTASEREQLKKKKDETIDALHRRIKQLEEEKANLTEVNMTLLKNVSVTQEKQPLKSVNPSWLDTEEGIAWQAGKSNLKRFFPRSSYKAMRKVLKLINPQNKPFRKTVETPKREGVDLILFDSAYDNSLLRLAMALLMNHDPEKTFADIVNTSDYARSKLSHYKFPLQADQKPGDEDNSKKAAVLRVLDEVAHIDREDYVAFNKQKCQEFSKKGPGYVKVNDDGSETVPKHLSFCLPGLQVMRLRDTLIAGRFLPVRKTYIDDLGKEYEQHKNHSVEAHSGCVITRGIKNG